MKQALRHLVQLDPSTWRVLLAGLLARLLVMPFATHSDLMGTYWGAHLISGHGELVFGVQALLRCLHAAYLWLVAPLLPHHDALWLHHIDDPSLNPFLSTEAWFSFVNHAQVFRTLFLLKFPYLFFDLGCVFLLLRLGSNGAKSRLMLRVWWFNPLVFFAVYIFGRHEVVALFFVLLSIYLARRDSWRAGLLALGVAIALRYYALLLLPFYVLSLQPAWKKRAQGLIIGLAPILIVNLVAWTLTGARPVKGLINLPHSAYLLSMKLQIAEWDNLYIFPLVYSLLLLHRLYDREYGWRSMQQYSLIALLLLFAVSYASPHYWTWFIPLLVMEIQEDRRLLPLLTAQIFCLAVYSFIGGRSMAGYLFASLAPDFFWSLPSPIEIITRFASPEMVISVARTAFSAVTIWMAYLVFKQMRTASAVGSGVEGAA